MMRRAAAPALIGLAALVPFAVGSRGGLYDDLVAYMRKRRML